MPKNSRKLYRQKALENILIHWLCHILHGLLYYLTFNTSVSEKLYCTYIDYFYCIFWKFHKAYFITFFFLPQIASTSLHFIHPSSCPFPTLKRKEKKKSYSENMEAGLCSSTTPENGACSWGWLIQSLLIHWRKPIFPSPRSYYLLAACWLGVGLCTHFLISMLG